ncbi:MAG: translation elongation factor Ts [Gaiellaceae bacterium]
MSVPASLVKELRDQTGAGMMDVKRALEESGGDLEEARKLLRVRGMAQAAKRSGRATSEGIVLVTISGHVGAMVAVGCETEPVSKNAEFLAFAEKTLETIEGGGSVDDLEDARAALVSRLRENIAIVDPVRMEAGDGESLAEYVHPPAQKIGVLLRLLGENPVAARQLAMHISFSQPRYRARDEISGADVEAEREIYFKQPDVLAKPEQVREKIVEGMLQKRFFAESVLGEQVWIHEPAKTVGQALTEAGIEVLEFRRLALTG